MNEEETALARKMRLRAYWSVGLLLVVLVGVYSFGYLEVAETRAIALKGLSQYETSQKANAESVGSLREQLDRLRDETTERLTSLTSHLEGLPGDAEALVVAANMAATERSLRRAQFVEIRALADKTLQTLTEVIRLAKALDELKQQIDAGPEGRKIAADRALVMQFAAITNTPIPTLDELANWREQCVTAIAPLDDIQDEDGANFVVTPALRSFLNSLLQKVENTTQVLMRRRTELKILIADSSTNSPSESALTDRTVEIQQEIYAEVMQATSQRHEDELRQTISEQMDRLHQEELNTLAVKHQIQLEEERQKRIAEQSSLDRLASQGEIAEQLRLTQQLRTQYQQDLPEMEQLLQPFFSAAHDSQPLAVSYEPGVTMVLTSRRIPLSFGSLNSCLALDADQDSLQRLYFIGGTHQNQRPKGSFPQYADHGLSNPSVTAKVNRARELLLKYGALLVENRKLSP